MAAEMYLLTESQKLHLVGKDFADDSSFNPLQDAAGNWVISFEEVAQCENEKFLWVQGLPTIPYNPKPFKM